MGFSDTWILINWFLDCFECLIFASVVVWNLIGDWLLVVLLPPMTKDLKCRFWIFGHNVCYCFDISGFKAHYYSVRATQGWDTWSFAVWCCLIFSKGIFTFRPLIINVCLVFPRVYGYKYHSYIHVSSQFLLTFAFPFIFMASSSKSLGETESSTGSAILPLVMVFQGDCLASQMLVFLMISAPKSCHQVALASGSVWEGSR